MKDFYPVAPMQQGLLLPSLYEQQSGIYIEQIICSLHEDLNVSALRQSWERVLERHCILRTSFHYQQSNQLMQSVSAGVQLPWKESDLRDLSRFEQQEQLDAYLQRDRKLGFDIQEAPLMRLALFQLADADYKLVWTFHHALLDGRSFSLVLKEVFTIYEAICQNQDYQLAEPRPYKDFTTWLQQYSPPNAEEFWRQLLQGFTTTTLLPGSNASMSAAMDAKVRTTSSGEQSVRLSEETTSALQALAEDHQLTLNTIVQGAWALLLGRYSGQDDVVFGAIRAGRGSALKELEDIKSMVGIFINTVPVRAKVEPDLPLLPWLKELRAQWMAMRDYEHTSLVKIQEWSEVPRGTALFESLLMFENGEMNAELRSQGGNWERREFELKEQIDYPLALCANATSDLLFTLHYDARRFDEHTISRLLGHLTTLLESIVANPNRCLWDLPFVTQAERHQLLVEWNDTRGYPKEACIHELFEIQAEQTPDAVAVVYQDQQLTYQELNIKANKLAHHLRTLGVGPEVLVGICVERSLEMVVGLLGILKAGGAYVPLDPKYPKERLADLLSDSQAPVLLTQQPLVTRLPEHNARVVCLDTDWKRIEQESAQKPESDVAPQHLAYIIYTSGSTGKPKGVTIEHRGAVNTIIDINERFGIGSTDRVLNVCSLNFDLSVYDVFGLLATGGAIVIPEASIAPNPARWLELMQREEITVWNSAPPVMQLFMSYVAGQSEVSLPALRLAMLSGDWIPITLPEQIKSVAQNVRVMSLGGATEASIWSIYYPIEAVEPTWKSIPYGRPLGNQQFYVLDSRLQPMPIGVAGELHIGGIGVARSYFNRPELTEQKFIPDPFSPEPDARLYKTGDLGRYLPDGNIEFLGRLDHQVKIRGFRIELGEIESVLTQHPQVREVLVIAREDRPGDKYLAAYVVPHPGKTPITSELRSFVKQTLPEYMVPAVALLDALPLTPNGKIDRRALPIPEQNSQETSKTFVAPRDRLESQLAQIWESTLGVQPIGVKDNFFELGGHSLLAANLWTQIEKVTEKKLPLATLFQAPTIEQLANALRDEGWSPSCSSLMVIQPGSPKKTPLFCIHVLGRGLEFYRPMARYFDPEQPMYGLTTEISTLDQKEAPPNRVEDLAAFYVKEMRTLQPQGPYLLVGTSFGGEVAFEMAQILMAQGEKVALLALLDTIKENAIKQVATSDRVSAHWSNLLKRGPVYIWEKFQPKIEAQLQNFDSNHKRICCKFYQRIGRPLPQELQEFTYRELNTEASDRYIPKVYPGRVTLIRAHDKAIDVSVSAYIDPELGWGGLATEGIEIHEVHGNHLSMLKEPHVRELAETLGACIDKALATAE
ncbi:MAG TPA: amino acid adenylation domain-containing protein [Chroococcales cyanobacterium]